MQGVFHILAFFYTEKFTNADTTSEYIVAAPGVKFDFGFGPEPLGV
jgi:hypothetical protein